MEKTFYGNYDVFIENRLFRCNKTLLCIKERPPSQIEKATQINRIPKNPIRLGGRKISGVIYYLSLGEKKKWKKYFWNIFLEFFCPGATVFLREIVKIKWTMARGEENNNFLVLKRGKMFNFFDNLGTVRLLVTTKFRKRLL